MSPCLCPCPHLWWHFLRPLLQEGQLPPATKNARERGELAGLALATLSVPLPALGLSPPGSRGHCFWGCHTANPTSSFATTCGCHHRGAISNKTRHSPPPCLGALSTLCPAGCLTARCWQCGVTPGMWRALRGLALPTQLARPPMAPQIHIPHLQHFACALSEVSLKGLAPPGPWGPIRPPTPGGSCLSHSAWRPLSSHKPNDGHPASAARAAVPSPSCAHCEAQ